MNDKQLLTDELKEALKFICKELYGHEDLSKAYIYCPYMPLMLTPTIFKEYEE
jgi:hypothetical protein